MTYITAHYLSSSSHYELQLISTMSSSSHYELQLTRAQQLTYELSLLYAKG